MTSRDQKIIFALAETRPDTRLPQSRAGGQEQCWRRSLEHFGRSSRLKKLKNAEKVDRVKKVERGPTDGLTKQPTDGPTDGPT